MDETYRAFSCLVNGVFKAIVREDKKTASDYELLSSIEKEVRLLQLGFESHAQLKDVEKGIVDSVIFDFVHDYND